MAFEVKNFVTPDQLSKDVAFSDTNLGGAMMEQASMYAHYAVLAAKAQRQYDDAKMYMEILEAKLDKVVRDDAATASKKLTEAQIAKEIMRHPDYIKLVKMVNSAKEVADLSRASLEAFKHRRDMLVQIGISAREERKGELAVMGPTDREESLRKRRQDFMSDWGKE